MTKAITSLSTIVGIVAMAATFFSPVEAARRQDPVSLLCSVQIVHEFRAQDGTVLRTETYDQDFVVVEGTPFVDDYSTVTREKIFRASASQIGRDAVLSVDWFADVSTFDSADFSTELTLLRNQAQGLTSASHTYSTSSGHARTSYTITAFRN
ncbi:MAG: hypothetical protein R3E01_29300 [Pirellulaceae bacterium]|nr:hypothetical protein [Planctomycetales bacterium]